MQRVLVTLRRSGEVPLQWIADNTRSPRQPLTFGNTSEAVRWPPGSTASRCGPMPTVRCRCGIEKDAMSGGLNLVTDRFDVPLMVSRGYSSVTFLR